MILESALLLFLLLLSAYFSSSEIAFFSLPKEKVRSFQQSGSPLRKHIALLLSKPQELLVTVFIANTLVNILLQNVASHMSGEGGSWVFKVGAPFLITLIFGEMIPKQLALQHSLYVAEKATPLLSFLHKLFKSVRDLAIFVTAPISRFFFFYLKKEPHLSREEIEHVLKSSEEGGVLVSAERELLIGYMSFQEKNVREIMRPKQEIVFANIEEATPGFLREIFTKSGFNRILICEKGIDNVLGILTARGFLELKKKAWDQERLRRKLKTPLFIPESSSAISLLKQLELRKKHMALVVNEYGSVSGLVTKTDLYNVIIGDMHESPDKGPLFTKGSKGEIIASGRLELEEVNKLLNVNFESKYNLLTLGGWITEKLEGIPATGTEFTLEGIHFHILSANHKQIYSVHLKKIPVES